MNRQSIYVLLLPIAAVLGLLFPSNFQNTSRKEAVRAQRVALTSKSETAAVLRPSAHDVGTGPRMVLDFLGLHADNVSRALPSADRESALKLHFLIATIPDPVDSGLPYMFDRALGAMEAALQNQGYSLYQFDLPWRDCLSTRHSTKVKRDSSDESPCHDQRRFVSEPGIVLWSKPQSRAELLLLYLVGETPTSGVHKDALTTALNEVAGFCGLGKNSSPEILRQSCTDIRLLAPTFSGSAQSLDIALSLWAENIPEVAAIPVRVVSASATAINSQADFQASRHLLPRFSFGTLEANVSNTFKVFQDYLREVEDEDYARSVALLAETGTVYGRGTGDSTAKSDVQVIHFPLHISQLRAASEKMRESLQQEQGQKPTTQQSLPLSESLEEVNESRDSIAPVNQMEAATVEQEMGDLLSTISRERFRYVGILATDVRDTMFLAQEVHQHCPTTVLFAFNPDLLFLHPEENAALRGMLIASSYPLFNSNQLLSPPYPTSTRPRRQFPDQASTGFYNAVMWQLDSPSEMLEYGIPFSMRADRPPFWVSVVGRDRFWPVAAYDWSREHRPDPDQIKLDLLQPPTAKDLWWRGVYPDGTTLLLFAMAIVAFIIAAGVLTRISVNSLPEGKTILRPVGEFLQNSWIDRALGQACHRGRRRYADFLLLAAIASLTTFFIVALTAFVVPIIAMWNFQALTSAALRHWAWSVGVSTVGLLAVFSLVGASCFLIIHVWRARHFARPDSKWSGLVLSLGILAGMSSTLFLSYSWLKPAFDKLETKSLFTSIRALDLRSGVSPLVPLFLIIGAGFLWSLRSFERIRLLDHVSDSLFLEFHGIVAEAAILENKVRKCLEQPSIRLSGALVVFAIVLSATVYLFVFRLVLSFETEAFYILLAVAFLLTSLLQWFGVLRFWCCWQKTRRLLKHLECTPMQQSYKRFRKEHRDYPKLDLATPVPGLMYLSYAVEQAESLCRCITKSQSATGIAGELRLKAAAGADQVAAEFRWTSEAPTVPPLPLSTEVGYSLGTSATDKLSKSLTRAKRALLQARKADAEGNWRALLNSKRYGEREMAVVTSEVAKLLGQSSNNNVPPNQGRESSSENFRNSCQDYLAGRVVAFLAYVMPQLQNLIVTSVAGLLLMLLAISSYPFQPHAVLLLFDWGVVLFFIAVAMLVFIQMNRDPVLSNLNGTAPGKLSWDWEFVSRIIVYALIPLTTLLGAQFPQSASQLFTHILPGSGGHP